MSLILRTFGFGLAAVVIAACGAGVGGTGTGNVYPPSSFGATASSVCLSPLGGLLDCGSTGAPKPNGTDTVFAADISGNIVARFDGDRVEIDAPCALLHFVGDWGSRDGEFRFWGTITRTPADVMPGTARLEVQVGSAMALTVTESAGMPVLGPVVLQRVSVKPTPSCR